eukprot:103040-Rhodomonas_salina.2
MQRSKTRIVRGKAPPSESASSELSKRAKQLEFQPLPGRCCGVVTAIRGPIVCNLWRPPPV